MEMSAGMLVLSWYGLDAGKEEISGAHKDGLQCETKKNSNFIVASPENFIEHGIRKIYKI